MRIYGKVVNGIFDNQRTFFDAVKSFNGRAIAIDINIRKPRRTNPQNSYLWGVVYKAISDFTGYSEEELHYEVFALMFRKYVDDKGNERIKNSSEMTTEECSNYIEKVRRWASVELGLYIPDPS